MFTELLKSPIPNLAGKALTVRGPIEPDLLGFTLMHEHILVDLRKSNQSSDATPVTEAALWDQKLTLENLHLARERKPIADNFILSDEELAIAETMEFRIRGGSAIVEMSNIGLKRDPLALRRISYATGLNIIMGTGFYQRLYHPPDMDQRSVEELTEEIVRDITVGADGTDVRAGIIGEVGIEGNPLTPNEIKSIRASARASRTTGVPISFHRAGVGREKLQVIGIVGEEGGDLTRIIMGHCDWIARDVPLLLEMLKMGVYAQFDLMGRVGAPLSWHFAQETTPPFIYATASISAEAILELVKAGYEDRILLSQDVATKVQLKRYGGTGYSFILEKFIPHLLAGGSTEKQVHKFMVENPKRVLTLAVPK